MGALLIICLSANSLMQCSAQEYKFPSMESCEKQQAKVERVVYTNRDYKTSGSYVICIPSK